ncbi:MAG: OsmC family protein [Vicinamibacterales bacterium]
MDFTNGDHASTADTTPDKGGANAGFRPHELLESALATCMNMTLRMVAERQQIRLAGASVTVVLDRSDPSHPVFEYRVQIDDVSDEERVALLSAIVTCPVRRTLSAPLAFRLATE